MDILTRCLTEWICCSHGVEKQIGDPLLQSNVLVVSTFFHFRLAAALFKHEWVLLIGETLNDSFKKLKLPLEIGFRVVVIHELEYFTQLDVTLELLTLKREVLAELAKTHRAESKRFLVRLHQLR